MKTQISTIGSSKGVIIPQELLEAAGIDREVSMAVKGQFFIIEKAGALRNEKVGTRVSNACMHLVTKN